MKTKRLEAIFEFVLWRSRYVVFIAVVASLVGSLTLMVLASIDVFLLVEDVFLNYLNSPRKDAFHNNVVAHLVGAIDDYLLATILLIFSLGLYELFISKIDEAEKDSVHSSQILLIKNLDDLKDRLAKVILMILIVTFFKNTIHTSFSQPIDILYLGGGILLVALSFYFTFRPHHPD